MSLAARPHHFAAPAPAPSCLSPLGSSRGVSHSGRIVSVRAAAGGQKPADSSFSATTATTTGGEGEKMGVIIVDHGSRRQASNLLLVSDISRRGGVGSRFFAFVVVGVVVCFACREALTKFDKLFLAFSQPFCIFLWRRTGGVCEDVSRGDRTTHRRAGPHGDFRT